jgi:hypothetical protein
MRHEWHPHIRALPAMFCSPSRFAAARSFPAQAGSMERGLSPERDHLGAGRGNFHMAPPASCGARGLRP